MMKNAAELNVMISSIAGDSYNVRLPECVVGWDETRWRMLLGAH
jgi:hypothetical protein